jgi:hypothetical protein
MHGLRMDSTAKYEACVRSHSYWNCFRVSQVVNNPPYGRLYVKCCITRQPATAEHLDQIYGATIWHLTHKSLHTRACNYVLEFYSILVQVKSGRASSCRRSGLSVLNVRNATSHHTRDLNLVTCIQNILLLQLLAPLKDQKQQAGCVVPVQAPMACSHT